MNREVHSGKNVQSLTEQVARKLCLMAGSDPDAKEPGDRPRCDGRGYGKEKSGEYREPWHWHWRDWTREARAVIRIVRSAK